ncbi:hypothetical protein HW555_010827 [Spodoptera exigua]|uniref:Uncharacterized protein n=1 Tax=Spodoptera exigua TaxID=7107 RepID=A0A835GAA9_SPOEX|nr:hypothetical protein HW555_010827 [Spodoptera exigua]
METSSNQQLTFIYLPILKKWTTACRLFELKTLFYFQHFNGQNIRSVKRNISGLKTLMSRSKIDWVVIILTECWISNNQFIPILDGYLSAFTTNNKTQNEGKSLASNVSRSYSPCINNLTSFQPNLSSLVLLPTDAHEIATIIAGLKPSSSLRCDDIPSNGQAQKYKALKKYEC